MDSYGLIKTTRSLCLKKEGKFSLYQLFKTTAKEINICVLWFQKDNFKSLFVVKFEVFFPIFSRSPFWLKIQAEQNSFSIFTSLKKTSEHQHLTEVVCFSSFPV